MKNTKIEWCDDTWNPVTGCLHGCPYCYARGVAKRFGGHINLEDMAEDVGINTEDPALEEEPLNDWERQGREEYTLHTLGIDCEDPKTGENFTLFDLHEPMVYYDPEPHIAPYPYIFEPTLHRYRLRQPQGTQHKRRVFVCSMADLFGEWVPEEWIRLVIDACAAAPQHKYLFLTKNPKRYEALLEVKALPIRHWLWLGNTVTCQNDLYVPRVHVQSFLSVEPMHGPIRLNRDQLAQVDWVIIGAESGRRRGKVTPKAEWILELEQQCRDFMIPVFLKNSVAPILGLDSIPEDRQQFPMGL